MSPDTEESLISGFTSALVAVLAAYIVSFMIPAGDLTWALIAVGVASFFSGFFSRYYAGGAMGTDDTTRRT